MPKFTAAGRDWVLTLDHGTIRRLKSEVGWDFYAIADDSEALTRDCFLFNHRLLPVLGAWLRPQLEKASVAAESLLDSFDGATLDAATVSVWEAFADFFRRHPMSVRMAKGGPKAVMAEMEAAIQAAGEAEILRRTHRAVATVDPTGIAPPSGAGGNGSFSNSPASSASIPPG